MKAEDRAALDRQQRIAATPEIAVERREPLPGQASFLDGERTGWNLVLSRPHTPAELAAIDERAAAEAESRDGKPKPAGKRKRKEESDA